MGKTTSIVLFIILFIVGCSKPAYYKAEELLPQIEQEIPDEPIKIVKIKNPIFEENFNLDKLTDTINISLNTAIPLETALNVIFKNKNISTVFNLQDTKQIQTTSMTTEKEEKLMISIPQYKGSIKDLLSSIMETHGIFFKYHNNTLTATTKESFAIQIDNYPDIEKIITASLKSFGVENVSYDPISSKIFFSTDYKTYKKIKNYAKNIRDNLSYTTFYIIVGEVELSDQFSRGIDWTKISTAYLSPSSILRENAAQGIEIEDIKIGEKSGYIQFGEEVTKLSVSSRNFGLNSFLKLLEKYGKFKTIQNTYITLQNGHKGKIDASQKTPYVKQIGTAVIGTGTATQATQTVDFDEASTGTIIEIASRYNSLTDLLTISIDGKIQSVINFINVSAGNITVSRPVTSVRNITTKIITKPQNIIILGGLISKRENYNNSGLIGLSNSPLGLYTENKKNTELVIIIKPQITRFIVEEN